MHNELDVTLDLDQQLCFALYSASRRVTRAYTEALRPFGLTYPQYLVLLVLWEWHRDGCDEPTVSKLCQRLELDSGTVTPLLRRMAALGVLEKQRQPNDERKVFVSLTDAGIRLRREVRSVPLAMLQSCSMPAAELVALRDQLKNL